MDYQVFVNENGLSTLLTMVRSIFLQRRNVELHDSWIGSFLNNQNITYYSIAYTNDAFIPANNSFGFNIPNVLMSF
jgi:hypothetical protein